MIRFRMWILNSWRHGVPNFHGFILKQLDILPTEIWQECCPVLRSRVRCISGCEKTDLVETLWSRYLLHPFQRFLNSRNMLVWSGLCPTGEVCAEIFGSQKLPEFFSDMNHALMPPPMNLGVMAWLKEQETASSTKATGAYNEPLESRKNWVKKNFNNSSRFLWINSMQRDFLRAVSRRPQDENHDRTAKVV